MPVSDAIILGQTHTGIAIGPDDMFSLHDVKALYHIRINTTATIYAYYSSVDILAMQSLNGKSDIIYYALLIGPYKHQLAEMKRTIVLLYLFRR